MRWSVRRYGLKFRRLIAGNKEAKPAALAKPGMAVAANGGVFEVQGEHSRLMYCASALHLNKRCQS